jgi:cobalamin biosynthesis protein CbiD
MGPPSLESVMDALKVAGMGGDLDRLAAACLDRADHHEGVGRERLLDAAAALNWANQILAAMRQEAAEDAHAGR